MSIAIEVLAQLQAVASENNLARIESFTLQAGSLRGIVPEALDMAFASAAEDTVAEDARIELKIIPTTARCRGCGQTFQPTAESFLCPHCNLADVELLHGNEVLLLSVEGTSP